MPLKNEGGVEIPCFRVNSKNDPPQAGFAAMDSLFAYKFDPRYSYDVFTYDSGSLKLYQRIPYQQIPINGWVTLDGFAVNAIFANYTLPSSIFCIVKEGQEIESLTTKGDIKWQSVYHRKGMNIIKTKYQMEAGLDPPIATDYSTPPDSTQNTYSTGKMIDYIG